MKIEQMFHKHKHRHTTLKCKHIHINSFFCVKNWRMARDPNTTGKFSNVFPFWVVANLKSVKYTALSF